MEKQIMSIEQQKEDCIRFPKNVFYNKQYTREEVHLLMHLLITANTKAKKDIFDGKLIVCHAGCMVTVPTFLSQQCGIKEKKIEGVLDSLEKYNFITQTKSNGNLLIKINNWNVYQIDYDDSL